MRDPRKTVNAFLGWAWVSTWFAAGWTTFGLAVLSIAERSVLAGVGWLVAAVSSFALYAVTART